MAALAGILKEQGHHVTGSDEHVYPPMSTLLEGLGIPIQNGYRPENLDADSRSGGGGQRHPPGEPRGPGGAGPKPPPPLPARGPEPLPGGGPPDPSWWPAPTARPPPPRSSPGCCMPWGWTPASWWGASPRISRPITGWDAGRFVALEGDEYDTAFFDKRPKFVHFHAPGRGAHLHRVRPRRHLPGPDPYHPGLRDFPGHGRRPAGGSWPGGTPPWCGRSAGATTPPSPFMGSTATSPGRPRPFTRPPAA